MAIPWDGFDESAALADADECVALVRDKVRGDFHKLVVELRALIAWEQENRSDPGVIMAATRLLDELTHKIDPFMWHP